MARTRPATHQVFEPARPLDLSSTEILRGGFGSPCLPSGELGAPPASASVPGGDNPGSKTGVAPFGRLRQWSSFDCISSVILFEWRGAKVSSVSPLIYGFEHYSTAPNV